VGRKAEVGEATEKASRQATLQMLEDVDTKRNQERREIQ
jgi:hypothetical protein